MAFAKLFIVSAVMLLDLRVGNAQGGESCENDMECSTGCCRTLLPSGGRQCTEPATESLGDTCFTTSGCDCAEGVCDDEAIPGNPGRCAIGVAEDPHMDGLRGQKIDWAGEDGGWYSLIKDDDTALDINVRVNAPLPEEFPHRQLVSGVAVMYGSHSLVLEFKNPYSTATDGCPSSNMGCLMDGGVRLVVDGTMTSDFPSAINGLDIADGIELSASNLPVECWKFGGAKIWARQYEEMTGIHRRLASESFAEWVLQSAKVAAPDWCAKYVSEHRDLLHVASTHAIFRIATPSGTVRVNAGINHQGDGEVDWDGKLLPELDFWQMDVGVESISVGDSITGILGETSRPVYDSSGEPVMRGSGAMRGKVEDYKVSGPLGRDFALLHETL